MAYQMAATARKIRCQGNAQVLVNVIHQLQAFSNAIHQTFVQHFTRLQLTLCLHGSSALAELLVNYSFPPTNFLIVLTAQLKCSQKQSSFLAHLIYAAKK